MRRAMVESAPTVSSSCLESMPPVIIHNDGLRQLLKGPDSPSRDEFNEICNLLEVHRALSLERGEVGSSGLYSAAVADEYTGYQAVWVRDNIHLANALRSCGEEKKAVRVVRAIANFYRTTVHRADDIISGKADANNPMHRPHIRFDGATGTESNEFWNHKQNDALSYFLWCFASLAKDQLLHPTEEEFALLGKLVLVLEKIEFWHDEDNGHWEEAVKVQASSIGAVVAAMRELQSLASEQFPGLDMQKLSSLESKGREALQSILLNECVQPGKERTYDSALLFLAYPLEVLTIEEEEKILQRVEQNLMGQIGVRRYNGDSYWCQDFKDQVKEEERCSAQEDTNASIAKRDELVQAGKEAQWCIFDPIMSLLHGRAFLRSRNPESLQKQRYHLRRSLGMVTGEECEFGAWKCPESYYCRKGEWVPNDVTPLLWTQANFMLALRAMDASLKVEEAARFDSTAGT
eukprot:TRINITY_DN43905_c0_g1_i1.p1 TRINITY_DN43905_c0_g1~~TRINITY_DN43905_c0_g1_i1.p1  ORF type:complete len:463 (+),score=90.75 TRINITY_DN43905_c0_g1_i1:32-1420(+)